MFDMVKPIVDRLLCTEWRAISKDQCPIDFARTRIPELSLVMPGTQLQAICNAGGNWRKTADKALVACVNDGSAVASLLFSSCVAGTLETKLSEIIHDGIAKVYGLKPAGGYINQGHIDELKATTMTNIMGMHGTLLFHPSSFSPL